MYSSCVVLAGKYNFLVLKWKSTYLKEIDEGCYQILTKIRCYWRITHMSHVYCKWVSVSFSPNTIFLISRLAHPDGSLADLTMMSTSPEPLLKEEKDKESMNKVLVVDYVEEEEKKKESLSINSAHLSSQEDIQQFSAATDPELHSEQSSGTVVQYSLV